jgi:RNA polymerase sigma-70 factor (ECF subfamily)
LVNIRRDQWRKERTRNRYAEDVRDEAEGSTDPERAFLAQARVWQALDRLPPRRRAVLVMHELDGLTVRDIASLLRINPVTIRWHLSRGRRELARVLRVEAGEADEQPQNSLERRRPAAARKAVP